MITAGHEISASDAYARMSAIADNMNAKKYDNAKNLCYEFLYRYDRGSDALKVAELLVKLDAKNADAYNYLGIVSFNNNRNIEASRAYAEALRLNPEHGMAMMNYANLLHRAGRLNDSEVFFRMSLEKLDKKYHATVYVGMANIYLDTAMPEEALKVALKACEMNPRDAGVCSITGIIYVALNDDISAEKYFLKALAAEPDRVKIHVNIARLYDRKGMNEKAREHYNKACMISKVLYGNDYKTWPQDDEKLRELFYLPLLNDGTVEDKNHCILNNGNLDDYIDNSDLSYKKLNDRQSVLHMHDVNVIGNGGHFVDEKNNTLFSNSVFVVHGLEKRAVVCNSGKKSYIILPEKTDNISEPVIYMGGANNYYHWICDYLPRLEILGSVPELKNLRVLINSDVAGFQKQSLELIGFDMSRIGYVDKYTYTRFSDVYLLHLSGRPLLGDNTVNWMKPAFSSTEAEWLRMIYSPYMKPKKENPKRLFLSREGAKFRLCLNEDEIFEIAKEYGFEKVKNEDYSFADQISLYAGAEAVMGVHGAGFTNMVFAPEKSVLIELHSKNELPLFYKNLTAVIGQKHIPVEGIVCEALRPLTPPFWNFTVEKEKVREVLEKEFGK